MKLKIRLALDEQHQNAVQENSVLTDCKHLALIGGTCIVLSLASVKIYSCLFYFSDAWNMRKGGKTLI